MDASSTKDFPAFNDRKHPRKSCQIPAKIFVSAELPPIQCTVVDISPAGAGLSLRVISTFGIPETFDLVMEDDNQKRLPCRVAWKRPQTLGVEFQKPFAAPKPAALMKVVDPLV